MVEVLSKPKVEQNEYALDVLVPTHNNLKLTIGCIDKLYTYTRTPFHLIVVDDSTDILTPLYFEELKKQHDNITFIHSDEPYKCGNQFFNIALSHCKTSYLATVMNSVEVEPEWELVGLKMMAENPKIGVIGFKCLFPDGRIESAGISLVKFLPCDMGRDEASHRLSGIYACDAVQWAFALIRVDAIKGNLTEDVFHGFKGWDDIDNCFMVRYKGWNVIYCGLGVGYHYPRATRGSNTEDAFLKNRENGEAFYKRWGLWDMYKQEHPTVPETRKDIEKIAYIYDIVPKRQGVE